jgi:hypothetical protein
MTKIDGITVLTDEIGLQREYRSESRKASVGERIKIVDATHAFGMYVNGDTLTVDRSGGLGVDVDAVATVDSGNDCGFITDAEYVVLAPTDVIHVDGNRYRVVERKACVGDTVIVTNAESNANQHGGYKNGDVAVVERLDTDDSAEGVYVDTTLASGGNAQLYASEYVVIERIESEAATPAPVKDRRATVVDPRISELEAKVDGILGTLAEVGRKLSRMDHVISGTASEGEYPTLPDVMRKVSRMDTQLRVAREDIVLIEEGVADDIDRLERAFGVGHYAKKAESITEIAEGIAKLSGSVRKLSREDVIERAKADVAELERELSDGDYPWTYEVMRGRGHQRVKYVINREKRTVAALVSNAYTSGKVSARGFARCSADDVFNSAIGSAIALRRALGLAIPEEYEKCPQPTEVNPQATDVVTANSTGRNGKYRIVAGERYWVAEVVGDSYRLIALGEGKYGGVWCNRSGFDFVRKVYV